MARTAFLFAGQGSQVVGMARDLCDRYPSCRRVFDHGNEILGRDLRRICLDGPETELTNTSNAQPGIFLTSLACLEALRVELPGIACEAAAGLSLGEFTALAVAGAFSFADGLRMVQSRGRFMQDACEATDGGMASIIGMEEAAVAEVCRESGVDLANLNCPGQIVISGEKAKVAQAVELAKTRGAKRAIPLVVAGAYHSRLMAGAQARVAEALAGLPMQLPRVPVVANVSACPGATVEEIKALLARQVTGSVRWAESIQWLIGQGYTRFIEFGPGNVLTGLMKRISKDVQMYNVADGASLAATVAAVAH